MARPSPNSRGAGKPTGIPETLGGVGAWTCKGGTGAQAGLLEGRPEHKGHKRTLSVSGRPPTLTLNDSKKLLLPPLPFSILSSSPPRPIMDWLLRCSSS